MTQSDRLAWPLLIAVVLATVAWIRWHDLQLALAVLVVVGAVMLTEMRVRSIERRIKEMRFR